MVAELITLRRRLRLRDAELARCMGISRGHLQEVLAGRNTAGAKVEIGLQRLRARAREEAQELLAAAGE